MLPQQVLMLQLAADALADAGDVGRTDDPRAGVFVGPRTRPEHDQLPPPLGRAAGRGRGRTPLTADRTMGDLGSIAASRIARAFGFGGPSFTCCSEETSAGRAVELAVRALRAGELDRAVVGGVDLAGDPRSVLPGPDGRIPGEGAAAVVLKRLADAERDGDRVYAVVTGVGSAVGGPADATGTDPATVASSYLRACADGLVDPATVAYLDAGTAGDGREDWPETTALSASLESTNRAFPIAVGSVRRQVGHAGAAAGAAGLVKPAGRMHTQILPPADAVTPQCESARHPRFWLADEADGPRRAAVAATGADGTVSHIVLEEHRATPSADPQPLGSRPEAVFAVVADTPTGLSARLPDSNNSWRVGPNGRSNGSPGSGTDDTRTGVGHGPSGWPPGRSPRLREQVASCWTPSAETRIDRSPTQPAHDLRPSVRDRVFYRPTPLGSDAHVGFVFPGSGNQFAGMGRALGSHFPDVLRYQQAENLRLRSQYAPDRFWADAIPDGTTAKQYLFGQVTLGTLTADLLRTLGVPADALLGQSLGESAGLFGLRVWHDRDTMLERIPDSTLFGPDLGPPYNAARQFWDVPAGESIDWVSGVLAVPADRVRRKRRSTGRRSC